MAIFGRYRMKDPVRGHAEVVDAWAYNPGRSGRNCRMTLKLDVPGVEPRLVDYHELLVFQHQWPEVGERLEVTVCRRHPDRVKVHWPRIRDAVRDAFSGGPAPGYEQRVDELNAQFRAGQITYEEMAEGIRRELS